MHDEGAIVAEERIGRVDDVVWLAVEDTPDCIQLRIDALRTGEEAEGIDWVTVAALALTLFERDNVEETASLVILETIASASMCP